MKKFIVLMATILVLSVIISPTASHAKFEVYWESEEIQFSDVLANNSHYGNITRLADKKIIMGTGKNRAGENLFAPNDKVTNRQVAIMLGRALKVNLSKTGTHRFTDVSSKDAAFGAIHALTEMGVYEKTKQFNPTGYATRQEVAKAISKAFKLTAQSNFAFKDVKKSDPYYPYIQRLAKVKITVADSKGNFNPKKAVTRAQFATFLQRALDLKQYLNQTTPELVSASKKLSLASDINEGREVYYDINPFGDPNEIAHFLYLRANGHEIDGIDYTDPRDNGNYLKITKDKMDKSLQSRYGFTIKNPETLKHSLIDYEPISFKPAFYENGNYFYLTSYTGNWGGPHKILIDNAVKIKNNIYYGLAYDFEIDEYSDYNQNHLINFELPFTKWKESHLKTANLINYYYFIAIEVETYTPGWGNSKTIDVVYRDREGFKTKGELDKFVSKFTKFK